jgi:hypothetical protein
MDNTIRTKSKLILTGIIMMVALAATAAVTATVAVVQIIPSAYAATATGGSASTEGACSTGTFADNLLASTGTSCGPNLSGSAGGDIALCTDFEGSISFGFKGTCSLSN